LANVGSCSDLRRNFSWRKGLMPGRYNTPAGGFRKVNFPGQILGWEHKCPARAATCSESSRREVPPVIRITQQRRLAEPKEARTAAKSGFALSAPCRQKPAYVLQNDRTKNSAVHSQGCTVRCRRKWVSDEQRRARQPRRSWRTVSGENWVELFRRTPAQSRRYWPFGMRPYS